MYILGFRTGFTLHAVLYVSSLEPLCLRHYYLVYMDSSWLGICSVCDLEGTEGAGLSLYCRGVQAVTQ